MASIEQGAEARPGVLDLYRAAWHSGVEFVAHYRLAIAVEVGMVALWLALRTFSGVESRSYLLWTLTASAIALVSPTSGLVILASTAPFYEPVTLSRALGMRHVLVGALGASVGLRLLFGGWRSMIWTAPVRLALALGVVTLLGVVNTWRVFPADWAIHAEQTWLVSIGGATILLLVGVWVARTGAQRFVVAAVVAATVAVTLSLVEQFSRGSISTSRLEWIGFWKDFGPRLGGAIASPNAMAALAVMPVCVLTAVAMLGARGPHLWRGVALRTVCAAAAAVLFVAMYLTYSRAALLSLFGLVVVIAWRLNRRVGQLVFVVGIVAGVLLLPTYLQLRGQAGSAGAIEPGSFLVATDRDRITAWQTAVGMWRSQPLLGQGFLAYKQLGDTYGDPVLSSPHNEWLRLFAEEGVVGGVIGLLFVATTLAWLAHGPGPLAAGILAGAAGYFTMATFNNPFLFVQVSAVVYPLIGLGLVAAWRARQASGASPGQTSNAIGDSSAVESSPGDQ